MFLSEPEIKGVRHIRSHSILLLFWNFFKCVVQLWNFLEISLSDLCQLSQKGIVKKYPKVLCWGRQKKIVFPLCHCFQNCFYKRPLGRIWFSPLSVQAWPVPLGFDKSVVITDRRGWLGWSALSWLPWMQQPAACCGMWGAGCPPPGAGLPPARMWQGSPWAATKQHSLQFGHDALRTGDSRWLPFCPSSVAMMGCFGVWGTSAPHLGLQSRAPLLCLFCPSLPPCLPIFLLVSKQFFPFLPFLWTLFTSMRVAWNSSPGLFLLDQRRCFLSHQQLRGSDRRPRTFASLSDTHGSAFVGQCGQMHSWRAKIIDP